jgi:CRISPR type III-A-associated protein Csm2
MQKPEDWYPKSKQGQRGGGPRPFPGGGGPGGRSTPPGGSGAGPDWPPKFEYQSGYFRENGRLRENLLTTEAEKQAYDFLHPPGRQKDLTSAQLRRFYHEVKALEAKIEAGGFETNAPLVKMLRSKVAYACPRDEKSRKIPDTFAKFLWKHVEQVRSKEDFKDFCTVFEAVVGFFYGQGGGR